MCGHQGPQEGEFTSRLQLSLPAPLGAFFGFWFHSLKGWCVAVSPPWEDLDCSVPGTKKEKRKWLLAAGALFHSHPPARLWVVPAQRPVTKSSPQGVPTPEVRTGPGWDSLATWSLASLSPTSEPPESSAAVLLVLFVDSALSWPILRP